MPIRVLANKQISCSSAIYFNSIMFLCPFNTEIDIGINSILRERSNLTNKSYLRSSLVFSSTFSISYHEHIDIDNNKLDNDNREPIDSFQLSYVDNSNKDKPISRMADNSPTNRIQYVSNEVPALMSSFPTQGHDNNSNGSNSDQQSIFNISVLYNINQIINQDL